MFLDLPEDIQLEIYALISPEDVLVLKQTCRVLHAFGCMDYVWHQMTLDLPLDLPPNQHIQSLRSSQIQPIVIKALRLERNWQGSPGRPWHLNRIKHEGIVKQMKPLGSRWLVTLSRLQSDTRLSLWCLKNNRAYHILETPAALRFSAALQSGSKGIIAVVERGKSGQEILNIYLLTLPREDDEECIFQLSQSASRQKGSGTIYDVNICENIVAAAIAKFVDMVSPPSYEILLINTTTHAQWVFDPKLSEHIGKLKFRVFPNRIVLVGVGTGNDALAIRVYALPSTMISGIGLNEAISESLISEYDLQFAFGFDFHISGDSITTKPNHLSIIVFPVFRQTKGKGYTFNLPLNSPVLQIRPKIITQPFCMQPKTSVDMACIGETGRRAVWLQHRWDTDEFELMKGSFSMAGSKVVSLLPRHLALPFEANACVSLSFDEAAGRVCVGLHTGELYILDF